MLFSTPGSPTANLSACTGSPLSVALEVVSRAFSIGSLLIYLAASGRDVAIGELNKRNKTMGATHERKIPIFPSYELQDGVSSFQGDNHGARTYWYAVL